MGRIGFPELLLIFFVVLLLFGTKRLPEIGGAIGQAIKEFKKASRDDDEPKPKDDSTPKVENKQP